MVAKRHGHDSLETSFAEEPVPSDAARVALWLQPRDIRLDVAAHCREQVLRAAAESIGPGNGLSADRVYDALWQREQAGSTALGEGFAIPHARLPGVSRPLTVYLRTSRPIDFGAFDGAPVSGFLVIVVPADGDNDHHLQLLALVARLFSDRRFRTQVGGASDTVAAADAFTAGVGRVLAS